MFSWLPNKSKTNLGANNNRYMAYLLTQEMSAIEQNSSSRDGKREDRKEEVTKVSMKLGLVFVCQGPVARSMVSVNQRLLPWQRIGFDTA